MSTKSWSLSREPLTPAVGSAPTTKVGLLGPEPPLPAAHFPMCWVLLGPPRGREKHSGGFWTPLHHLLHATLGPLFMRSASPAGQVCLRLCKSFDLL